MATGHRSRIAAVGLPAALALVGVLSWNATSASAGPAGPGIPALIERDNCHGKSHPTKHPNVFGNTITVAVHPTAVVKIDGGGRPVAAMTNTGCAPRPEDDTYVWHTDGTIEQIATVDPPDAGWSGNFTTPGKFRPQRP